MTTTTNDTAAMERALLTENVADAIVLEKGHLSAAEDVASAAQRALRYDVGKASFVDRDSGEPLSVRDWLKNQRENRPHWFRAASADEKPTIGHKRAGFDPSASEPTPPGTPTPKEAAPVGRNYRQMSEREYADYKRQNRHARVVSAANVAGRRVYTVDCGSAASAQQVGGQSMDDYRKWRESQGLGRPMTGR